ncbi:hypothetical protein H6F76_16310 [Leptolyngbya sp. FACHB-321]|uniref:hypothetical protein n=1 Tax=Leptolyngbya sp. FACHB-321 TaxID=2692807 RepID=UPI0016832AC7|nr:hypothetical protein [Leptolyngbya sp. FACHB-321]MBD2036576.1 hypothetical protein [Leptolyngbya sp. FACHB-321]
MQIPNEPAWLGFLKHNAAKLLSTTLLICLASLLTTHTILLQNSCTPLLEWTTISKECLAAKPGPSKKRPDNTPPAKPPDGRQTKPGKVPNPVDKKTTGGNEGVSDLNRKENKGRKTDGSKKVGKEVIGVAAGSAAVVGLAVIEAPVIVAAGVGFAVWIAARTLLSLGN